jgi:hypothetical protein
MSRVDNSLNIITLALVLAISVGSAGTAMAADARTPTLLWPKESIAASQSTKALVIGHTGRAVKYAERALDNAKGYDRVVALHNLCLGLIRQGDAARAKSTCAEAQLTSAEFGYDKIVQANIEITRKFASTRSETNVAEAQR